MKKRLILKNLLILASLIIYPQKSHSMQNINIDYAKALQTAASLTAGLGIFAISTVIHECGHAFAAKILLNSPLDINIGGYSNNSIAKIGFFSLRGFNPFIGFATTDLTNSKKIERILIYLAGPCAGAITSLCFSQLYDNQIYKLACCVSSIIEISNVYPQSIDSDSEQLKSDGVSILEECIDKELTNKITSVLSNVIIRNALIGIFTYLALNKLEKLNFCCSEQIVREIFT
jgi:hypothetical protein